MRKIIIVLSVAMSILLLCSCKQPSGQSEVPSIDSLIVGTDTLVADTAGVDTLLPND